MVYHDQTSLKIKLGNIKLDKIDVASIIFLLTACITVAITIFYLSFIFYMALPIFMKEGVWFILGTDWNYATNSYGILYYIAGTFSMTIVTMTLACPLSIFTAIFLAKFSPGWLSNTLKLMVELLVGIPSVVYGIFGLFVLEEIFRYQINPFIDATLGFIPIFKNVQPNGVATCIMLGSTVLTIMILPTIMSLSYDAIKAVPREYEEASMSLGATRWETIKKIVVPSASSGIMMAVTMGMMRAVGETMAVVMLLGGSLKIPTSIFDSGYAMTSRILNDIGYYIHLSEPRSALFGIAAMLIVFEIIMVATARLIVRRLQWAQQ